MANYSITLPTIGLGAAPLGTQWGFLPDDVAISTIQTGLAAGVNLIDTSPYYGLGVSERRVGIALQETPRDSYILSTKVGNNIGLDGRFEIDYSETAILNSLSGSLDRLQVSNVDILLIHEAAITNSDQYIPAMIEQAYPVLDRLRREGTVRAIGAGLNLSRTLLALLPHTDFDVVLLAGRYTLLEQDGLQALNECHRLGIDILLAGIFNSGILAVGSQMGAWYDYAPAPDPVLDKVSRIEAICLTHQVPLRVAATQFPLLHPAVNTIVVGVRESHEILAAVRALQTPVPSNMWIDLMDAGLLDPETPISS